MCRMRAAQTPDAGREGTHSFTHDGFHPCNERLAASINRMSRFSADQPMTTGDMRGRASLSMSTMRGPLTTIGLVREPMRIAMVRMFFAVRRSESRR